MSITDFTYGAYRSLLELIDTKGFKFSGYCHYNDETSTSKKCILRHDIDNSIAAAIKISKIEYEMGISSTFFVLLVTNFYNVFSKENHNMLDSILQQGHKIGLHFDEAKYGELNRQSFEEAIQEEAFVLGRLLGTTIKAVSMHRSSQQTLDADYNFNGIVNSYSYKYLSDSRMCLKQISENVKHLT